jgi:type IV pilus assembly protein PilZ
MTVSSKQSDETGLTARFRELLRDLPFFIENASTDQKQALLRLFEEMMPLYVRLLEDMRHQDRREHPRKPCSLTAYFPTWEGSFESFVHNISRGGMFIQTRRVLPPGHQITVSLPPLPNKKEMMKVTGEIVWSVPEGLGIKFTSVSDDLKDMIESL